MQFWHFAKQVVFAIYTNKFKHGECHIQGQINMCNFVRERDGKQFEEAIMLDFESAQWTASRGSITGADIRDNFKDIFMSPAGEVTWQLQAIS